MAKSQAPFVPDQPTRPRLGPRPLPLHLTLHNLTWTISLAALPGLRSGSLGWNPGLGPAADALAQAGANHPPEALSAAVARAAARLAQGFAQGVLAYLKHPACRALADPPTIWREDPARLLDYGAVPEAAPDATAGVGGAIPVLVVPSLVNRAHVLDLEADRSLLRFLAAQGIRPLLLDWGEPGPRELGFNLDAVILGPLARALDAARAVAGTAVPVIGYCMGGLLAMALAHARPTDVSALVLLATPWDFAAAQPAQAAAIAALAPSVRQAVRRIGSLPVDILQAMFFSLDPYGGLAKFRAFAALDPNCAEARRFVLLEDWLNDGVPLAGPVADETLIGWYGDNEPGRSAWRIDGRPVRPERIAQPALVVVPERDRIVPPASAWPLVRALPQAESLALNAGHVGMVVGGSAERILHRPLARWLAAHRPPGRRP